MLSIPKATTTQTAVRYVKSANLYLSHVLLENNNGSLVYFLIQLLTLLPLSGESTTKKDQLLRGSPKVKIPPVWHVPVTTEGGILSRVNVVVTYTRDKNLALPRILEVKKYVLILIS